jgi:hypothetical protein
VIEPLGLGFLASLLNDEIRKLIQLRDCLGHQSNIVESRNLNLQNLWLAISDMIKVQNGLCQLLLGSQQSDGWFSLLPELRDSINDTTTDLKQSHYARFRNRQRRMETHGSSHEIRSKMCQYASIIIEHLISLEPDHDVMTIACCQTKLLPTIPTTEDSAAANATAYEAIEKEVDEEAEALLRMEGEVKRRQGGSRTG